MRVRKDDLLNPDDSEFDMVNFLSGFGFDEETLLKELEVPLEDQTSNDGFLAREDPTDAGQEPEGQAGLTLNNHTLPDAETWYPISPEPLDVLPVANVHIQEPPTTTYYIIRLPIHSPGTTTGPTFGEQSDFNVVPPVLPIPNTPPSQTEETEGREKPYVKKPPNAFMLFLKENRASAQEELGVKTSIVVNKHLGEKWKSMSKEERSKYENEAKEKSELHSTINPGWTNKINYRNKKKRSWKKVEGISKLS